MAKTYATEVLWRVVNHAVQINGGNGYMSEYPFERFLRDARIKLIEFVDLESSQVYLAIRSGNFQVVDVGLLQHNLGDPTLFEILSELAPDLLPQRSPG